jgi:hypothetical protein
VECPAVQVLDVAFVRKHLEAMVFTALAEELCTGDVAVAGSEEYADWSEQLLPREEKLGDYLVEVGVAEPDEAVPYDAVAFRRQLEDKLTAAAATAAAGYPDDEGLVIDPETGHSQEDSVCLLDRHTVVTV